MVLSYFLRKYAQIFQFLSLLKQSSALITVKLIQIQITICQQIMLAKLGGLIMKKKPDQEKQTKIVVPDSLHQNSESFYSLENQNSKFDKSSYSSASPTKEITQEQANLENLYTNYYQMPKVALTQQAQKSWKIGQSLDIIYQQSRLINETTQRITKEKDEKGEDGLNLSQIKSHSYRDDGNIEQEGQQASILKEIQLLSSQCFKKNDNYKQAKQESNAKIEQLQKQQKQLQNSLNIAIEMLKNSKSRNQLLEQQLKTQKQQNQEKKTMPKDWKLISTEKGVLKQTEHRNFPQFQSNTSDKSSLKLRQLYKQCSMSPILKIFQNQAYEIIIQYNDTSLSQLIVTLTLSPKKRLLSQPRYKFFIKFMENSNKSIDENDFNKYQHQEIKDELIFDEQHQSNMEHIFTAKIGEYDTKLKKSNTWELLIPIPVSWFMRRRFSSLENKSYTERVKKLMSRYEIEMRSKVKNYEEMSECWWSKSDAYFSIIGCKQLLKFEIERKGQKKKQSQEIDLVFRVYGRKNGEQLRAFIQFVSFYLSVD